MRTQIQNGQVHLERKKKIHMIDKLLALFIKVASVSGEEGTPYWRNP